MELDVYEYLDVNVDVYVNVYAKNAVSLYS